jgi:hypothetical protein
MNAKSPRPQIVVSIASAVLSAAVLSAMPSDSAKPSLSRDTQVTEADVAEYYAKNSREFTAKEQVRLFVFSVQRMPSETDTMLLGRFRRAYEQLQVTERKAKADRTTAISFMRDWGWVDRDSLKKPVSDIVFGIKTGTTTDPIVTPEACLILHVTARKEAGLQPLDEVRSIIIEKLRRMRDPTFVLPPNGPRL